MSSSSFQPELPGRRVGGDRGAEVGLTSANRAVAKTSNVYCVGTFAVFSKHLTLTHFRLSNISVFDRILITQELLTLAVAEVIQFIRQPNNHRRFIPNQHNDRGCEPVCFKCGRPGHIDRNCSSNVKNNQGHPLN